MRRSAGKHSGRVLGLLLLSHFLLVPSLSFAQGTDEQTRGLQLDGWQGRRPTPQQAPPPSSPQRHAPVQPQIPELPPVSPPSMQSIPRQQGLPTTHLQKRTKRPTQFLTVTVTDQNGQYINGLTPEDFIVYEGGQSQLITYFNTGQQEPVSLGLLVDMSASMHGKRRRAILALRSFAQAIKPGDEVFLLGFNHQLTLLQDFTDSPSLLTQATSGLQPSGDTALYDAVLGGLQRIQRGQRQKKALIILMSGGLDTSSTASREDAFRAARKANILVYTISIGDLSQGVRGRQMPMWGPNPLGGRMGGPFMPSRGRPNLGSVDVSLLQSLSDTTGAQYFFLSPKDVLGSHTVLEQATQTIARELRQQYSLGYLSPLKGDVYREVQVEIRHPHHTGLIVRTHKGTG